MENHRVDVRWTTAFVDRPAATFEVSRDFWRAVTGTTLSTTRGEFDEFATFLPTEGDAFLRLQRVHDGPGGSHLDLHVDDARVAADAAITLGATEVTDLGAVVVLRSPGGLVFCFVPHPGEATRPSPVGQPDRRTLVDQLSIDIAPDRYEDDCGFWATLTGWELRPTSNVDLRVLVRADGMPLRILLQRRGPDDVGLDAHCHLDLACDDVERSSADHQTLGASLVHRFPLWTVMADPSGIEYCLTSRDPDSGLLPPSGDAPR